MRKKQNQYVKYSRTDLELCEFVLCKLHQKRECEVTAVTQAWAAICHSKPVLLRTLVDGEHQGGENRKWNVGSQDCGLLRGRSIIITKSPISPLGKRWKQYR